METMEICMDHTIQSSIYICSDIMDNPTEVLESNNVYESSQIKSPYMDDLKPFIGTTFESLEDVFAFYTKYAHDFGFSVRKSSESKDTKTNEVNRKYFVCSKQGFKQDKKAPIDNNADEKEKRKSITREGCEAKLVVRKNEENKWVVSKFDEEHSHALATPTKRHFLRSARKVTSTHKALHSVFSQANVPTSKMMHVLKVQVGGYENIGCLDRDIRNYEKMKRQSTRDSDAFFFIENLENKKKAHPSFYYAYELDEEKRLKNVFWADGISRKNYALFGDVVVFDTTYETNKYLMIFAPFTGVNHHKQSITFGAALLRNERIDSFIWLFENFLDAMDGHQMEAIITNQDPAMTAAIKVSFKNATHRFCMWHILKKVSEKAGPIVSSNPQFQKKLKSCVWSSKTPTEFEKSWEEILQEYHLGKKDWFSQMYGLREMWIPAYFKDMFWAGLRTTQRSESMNFFFSHFVNKELSLAEFWLQFENAIDLQRQKELEADYKTLYSKVELKIDDDLEKQMAELMTRESFYIFQEELYFSCIRCTAMKIKEEGHISIQLVKEKAGEFCIKREVTYNQMTRIANCTCKFFESEGIPCRHVLVVLRWNSVEVLPDYYIKNRWTKNATRKPQFDVFGNELKDCSTVVGSLNLAQLWDSFSRCLYLAGKSNETYLMAKEKVADLEEKNERMVTSRQYQCKFKTRRFFSDFKSTF